MMISNSENSLPVILLWVIAILNAFIVLAVLLKFSDSISNSYVYALVILELMVVVLATRQTKRRNTSELS